MMSQTSSLTKELEAYERMRSSLETEHLGEWVVVHDETVVGYFDSFDDAAKEAVKLFGRGPYLIRQVGEGPITLPASVLYAPANLYADN
ncbi:MAG: hypothetical protein OXF94_11825 [Gammaproteobacteria bacterium]|nr:hypothetical protein [Gammaproteobacteria bacterium]